MADQVALTVERRAGSGKGEARALRRQGKVPAVIYGAGVEPTAVSVNERELFHALHTEAGANAVLRLVVDGDAHLAFPREIHRHPVRRNVLHVDFVTIDRRRRTQLHVPLHLEGVDDVADGGVLSQDLHAVHIEVLPLEVPTAITLDVSGMQVGDVKHLSDLVLPEGVESLDDPETVVVSLTTPDAATEDDLADATTPDVEGTAADAVAARAQAKGATGDEASLAADGA